MSLMRPLLALLAASVAYAQQPAGTGSIAGRVVLSHDGGSAVRRAIVTLGGGGLSHSRSEITNDDGVFVFTNVPAGHFTLAASRPGFIPSSYGARAPGHPGSRVSLAAGQRLENAVIRMARGAAISGVVRNEIGEPMPNITVTVSGTRPIDERAGHAGIDVDCQGLCASVITDDRGVYRAFGLPAGAYLVAGFYEDDRVDLLTTAEVEAAFAEAQRTFGRSAASTTSIGREVGRPQPGRQARYGPVFFPGTADAAVAQRVTVEFGDERNGVDIVLMPSPASTVEGTVVSPTGSMPRVTMVMLSHNPVAIPSDMQPEFRTSRGPITHPVSSGDFQFSGVTPGRYTITVRAQAGQVVAGPDGRVTRITSDGPVPPPLWASAEVTVAGGDISGVHLPLRPALRMAGRIQFEGTAKPPADLTNVPVSLVRASADAAIGAEINAAAFRDLPLATTRALADGRFELTAVYPGLYQISSGVPGNAWRLRSAVVDGRDVLDDPLVVSPDRVADLPAIVLTYADRRTEVTGTLQTPAGAPATDYFIVVFTTERRWWRASGRRLAFSRPATDGQFVVRDLPPGDYYIAALTDLDITTWQTPEFLDQVVPGSLKLTLGEGETKTQDLRIAQE